MWTGCSPSRKPRSDTAPCRSMSRRSSSVRCTNRRGRRQPHRRSTLKLRPAMIQPQQAESWNAKALCNGGTAAKSTNMSRAIRFLSPLCPVVVLRQVWTDYAASPQPELRARRGRMRLCLSTLRPGGGRPLRSMSLKVLSSRF